jgi:hypothetical protein
MRKIASTQLARFIGRYEPVIQRRARGVLARMRKHLQGAVEMVYDNYNALVIGFGPTERPSEAIVSVVLYPRWVTLCFLHGARLIDPERMLRGNGKQVRSIVLHDVHTLETLAVRELLAQACERSKTPIDSTKPRRIVIKSVSPTRRPRRPAQ